MNSYNLLVQNWIKDAKAAADAAESLKTAFIMASEATTNEEIVGAASFASVASKDAHTALTLAKKAASSALKLVGPIAERSCKF